MAQVKATYMALRPVAPDPFYPTTGAKTFLPYFLIDRSGHNVALGLGYLTTVDQRTAQPGKRPESWLAKRGPASH